MSSLPNQSNHPATGTAPDYHFTAAAPSSRVAPTQIDQLPQQAHTQPVDGDIYATEPEAMTQSESTSSGVKVPFKEQVIGYSQKFRGTLLGKPDLKAHGVAILEGRTTHAEDRDRRRKSSSDSGTRNV